MKSVFTMNPTASTTIAGAVASRNTYSHAAIGTYTLHDPTIGKKPITKLTSASATESGIPNVTASANTTTLLIACDSTVAYTAPARTPRTFAASASASGLYRLDS